MKRYPLFAGHCSLDMEICSIILYVFAWVESLEVSGSFSGDGNTCCPC